MIRWRENERPAGVSPVAVRPTTVANYISRMADDMAAVATIERRLAAVAKSQGEKAAEDPTVLDPTVLDPTVLDPTVLDPTGDPLVRAALASFLGSPPVILSVRTDPVLEDSTVIPSQWAQPGPGPLGGQGRRDDTLELWPPSP